MRRIIESVRGLLLLMVVLSTAIAADLAEAQDTPQVFEPGDFQLESGVTLPKARWAYTTFGRLNAEKSNAVLLPSHFMADHHGYGFLIGPGKALDPSRDFIILTNSFSNGVSSSPSNTPDPFAGPKFPRVSVRDNVRAAHRLVTERLGISRLKAVVGFSMGGQQAYQWAVSHPEAVEAVVVLCGNARQYPFGFVRLEGAKAALTTDPAFQGGAYTSPPERGLRALGLHWSAWAFSPAWWNRQTHRTAHGRTFQQELKSWETAFLPLDANNLLSQIDTWQRHDVGKTPGFDGDLTKALRSIKPRVLLMPSTTDQYFPLADAEAERRHIPQATLVPIPSNWGHTAGGGANPQDAEFINAEIRKFLARMDEGG